MTVQVKCGALWPIDEPNAEDRAFDAAHYCGRAAGHAGHHECRCGNVTARRCTCGHLARQHEIRSGGLFGCIIAGCLCIDLEEVR